MKEVISKSAVTPLKTALFAAAVFASQAASAAGFDDATSIATNVRTGIYTFVGIVAGIVILWLCYEGSQGQKRWNDIVVACLRVLAAAASLAFVGYLFTRGGQMTF